MELRSHESRPEPEGPAGAGDDGREVRPAEFPNLGGVALVTVPDLSKTSRELTCQRQVTPIELSHSDPQTDNKLITGPNRRPTICLNSPVPHHRLVKTCICLDKGKYKQRKTKGTHGNLRHPDWIQKKTSRINLI